MEFSCMIAKYNIYKVDDLTTLLTWRCNQNKENGMKRIQYMCTRAHSTVEKIGSLLLLFYCLFQYEQISFRRSIISNAIKLLMLTTPISAKACLEFDLLLISFLIVSVNSSAFPSGRTSNLQASWILERKIYGKTVKKLISTRPHNHIDHD